MSEKKKSLFSKALDIFSEEVPTKNAPQVSEGNASNAVIPSETINFETSVPDRFRSKPITNSPITSKGGFNEEFYNHFQDEIAKNNLEGADYFEFRKTYDVLSKSMPEVAALNATFQALRATSPNLTVERLLETADYYLDIIEKEDSDFSSQYDNKIGVEIAGREASIADEQEKQRQKREMIAQLEAEISESENIVHTLQSEMTTESQKFNEVKANWDFTIKLVKQNIITDKTNITTHLSNS